MSTRLRAHEHFSKHGYKRSLYFVEGKISERKTSFAKTAGKFHKHNFWCEKNELSTPFHRAVQTCTFISLMVRQEGKKESCALSDVALKIITCHFLKTPIIAKTTLHDSYMHNYPTASLLGAARFPVISVCFITMVTLLVRDFCTSFIKSYICYDFFSGYSLILPGKSYN